MQQQQKSELTKNVILQKSFEMFYQNGFKTTSVDRIMAATNLTKGAFYHHFKNKKELGLAVISSKIRKRVVNGMILPLNANGDAIEIIEATFLERLKTFPIYDKQHGCPMNNFINEIGDVETAYQIALKKIIEEWKVALVDLIERGKREETIKQDISSEAVAIYLISAFEGIRGLRKLYTDDAVLDAYVTGLSMYINQIKA